MPAVEPVLRTLHILEALNRRHAPASLAQLCDATDLPKPTVSRLLQTLEEGGYVTRLPRRLGYALRERTLRLSSGFRYSDVVVEAARPFLSALTAELKWPVGLATLDRDAMRVRFSTGRESPFAIDENFVNRRVPMLLSALGRAYLAFCSADEREKILDLLRASPRETDRMARDPRAVARLIQSARRAGFASAAEYPSAPAHGVAVPVLLGGTAIAAITLRYLGRRLPEREAAQRYLAPLQRASLSTAAAMKDHPL
ncbi:MAG: DNA-binding transcriptional regulator [Proteobacteria bacterium]|nr:DNA-binding transcriptional regulator [Pseudomonadota bacterium]